MRRIGLLFLLSGCALVDALSSSGAGTGGNPDAALSPDCTVPPCREIIAELPPAAPTRDLDILFVIDNSHSMHEEQEALLAAFPTFMDVLGTIGGGLPNVHIGVISTDIGIGEHATTGCEGQGENGVLQAAPRIAGCQPPAGRFIRDVESGGERERNYSASLPDTFSCIAALGIEGCGLEQPLNAMKLALDGSRPENAGFLRPSSFLAVVFLSDEDDCSVSNAAILDPTAESAFGPFSSFRCTEFGVICDGMPLSRTPMAYGSCASRPDSYLYQPRFFADFLLSLRRPSQLFVAAIVAPATPFEVGLTDRSSPDLAPSCQSAAGTADPAVRLHELVALFPGHSAAASICATDLVDPLRELGKQLSTLLTGACLWGLLLDASSEPGLQPDCQVFEKRGATRTRIPACEGSGPDPCHAFVSDAALCPYSPGQLRLAVRRTSAPAPDATYVLECFRPQ
jgi:hypothetical protein